MFQVNKKFIKKKEKKLYNIFVNKDSLTFI